MHASDGERFDEVVLAAHADQALAMLADPTPPERELLGAFPYQANEAVLHTDRRLLPRRRRAWASWNYHLSSSRPAGDGDLPHEPPAVAATPTASTCVTLNRTEAIDPGRSSA